jgi:glycosyltransferase involved in cell wall biosynthesis
VKEAQSLADVVLQFAQLTPEQRSAMGEAGRNRVMMNFSDERVIQQYDNFLQTI